jgi:DNA-binding XRE family transcriptional regulator
MGGEPLKVIRNRLHRVLFEREVLGKDFANWCEMDPSHFNRIKNGHVVPSLKTALRICEILGLEVEEVFSLETTVKSSPARASLSGAERRRAAEKLAV